MNEPVTTPLFDTLQLGDVIMLAGVEVMMQVESTPLNAVPWIVIVVPLGPSDGETTSCGPVGGGATEKVPEALSPNDPFTIMA